MTRLGIIKSAFLDFNENGLNLVSHLAMQGENEVVERCIGFGGKVEDAIYGYALAGNTTIVNSFIERASEDKIIQYTKSAVRGFARANNSASIQALAQYRNYKEDRLLGLAQAGKKEEVTAIVDYNIGLFSFAVKGYADCNHAVLLEKLIQGTSSYPLAIYHAARAGHSDLVNNLLAQCGVDSKDLTFSTEMLSESGNSIKEIDAYALLNQAVRGYVAGCHFREAAQMLARGASVSLCISELDQLQGQPNLDSYLVLLAHSNHAEVRNKLYDNLATLGKLSDDFIIDLPTMERIKQEMECMETNHLNYLEAHRKIGNEDVDAIDGDITLSSLTTVVKEELSLHSTEPSNGLASSSA